MQEYIINRSKFYSQCYSVSTLEDIEIILLELKRLHRRASHICYAFRVTIDSIQQEKAVDDGEPSGTAGRPLLSVLQMQKLNNTLLVVVRYFGGIKLGAGGLLRAYSKSASKAVKCYESS